MLKTIHRRTYEFIHSQSGGGIVLSVAALLALIISNSPCSSWYELLLQVRGEIRVGGDWQELSKPLLVWTDIQPLFSTIGL